MLYLLVGNDSQKRVDRTRNILDSLTKKRPQASRIDFQSDTFSESVLSEHLATRGLFDDKSIIRFIGVLENTQHKDSILPFLSVMASSENAFVFTEEKLTKPIIGKFEKAGGTVELFESVVKQNNLPKIFDIADLLLTQKKQKLLISLYEFTNRGTSTEEIVGIMMWQLKSLSLALRVNQSESGMTSFVYNKCKKSNWKLETAQQKYFDLTVIYHESRRGGLPLFNRIEQFILEL